MARSEYIWILFQDGDAIEAFTVKHEMVSFVKKLNQEKQNDDFFYDYRVFRFKDGGRSAGSEVEVELWGLVNG